MVPAYFGPWATPDWDALVAQRPAVVIMNPASGPGAAPDPGYHPLLARLRDVGAAVLGYVSTGWLTRPAEALRTEVARYQAWYGVDGVFYDEIPNGPWPGRTARLANLVADPGPGALVVFNSGLAVPERWYRLLPSAVFCTFEGAPAQLRRSSFVGPPSRQAHLVHSVTPSTRRSVEAVLADRGVALTGVTDDRLPNPWDVCPMARRRIVRRTVIRRA